MLNGTKLFNDHFVYKPLKDGNLEVTHISLEAFLDLYAIHRHCNNLHLLLIKNLTAKYIKNIA